MSTFETEVQEAQQRFKKRKLITAVQPYVDHIELFLSCISPEYAAETQEALVTLQLASQKAKDFTAPNARTPFNWQTTDDAGDTLHGEKVLNDFGARAIYGPLQDAYKQVVLLNARACGVFVAINEIEGSRRLKDLVTTGRAIWVEDDDKQLRGPRPVSDFPLPYSFVVETSDRKYHYYWLTYTKDLRIWERLQSEVMTEKFGSDPGANGLNRAMRIPGFWHKKTNKFASRIVYMVDHEFKKIEPIPSDEFYEYAVPNGGKIEYAYDVALATEVKRYDWEEILNTFGELLPDVQVGLGDTSFDSSGVAIFDPIESMNSVFTGTDYHSSLHALCMHFANFVQDPKYVTDLVQSLMCRVPETDRNRRWQARFNDVKRSARAAVNKKIEEMAVTTLLPTDTLKVKETGLHGDDWVIDFPDLKGACEPLDMLMANFERILPDPIRSFNFATIISIFSVMSQNIPAMPVLKTRKANGCHLMLARSAGGKDLNVSGPIRALTRSLLQDGHVNATDFRSNEILYSMLAGNAEITSLTAFHRWALNNNNSSGAIWRNTECTSIIAKMTDENASVANLSEVVINIQDGIPIPPVTKASGKDSKDSPGPLVESYTLLFATQPLSIKRYMNPRLLYKGVIGRFDYYVPEKPESDEITSFLDAEITNDYTFSAEVLDFLRYALTVCSNHVTSTSKDPSDEISRNVIIQYDNDWHETSRNGPNRQAHVDWDKDRRHKYYTDDMEFRTFIDRVAMSTERYLTTLVFMQHLWIHYKANTDPFGKQPAATPELIDCVKKLGDYQYEVRVHRIWSLIAREKGLDDKHQAMLDAIKSSDSKPTRWQNVLKDTPQERAYNHLFQKERYMPISGVLRYLPKDCGILTKDGINICLALADFGYIEFVKLKQVDLRVSNKALKNVVRLTAQGRL